MRRLYKSRSDKIIDGVCGGIAEYFEIDPVIVRLIAVILFLTGGVGFIAYIVGMIIIPAKPEGDIPGESSTAKSKTSGNGNSRTVGIILLILGVVFLFRNVPVFRGCYWWFRNLSWDYILPVALILAGIYFLAKKGNTALSKKDTEPPKKE